MQNNIYIYITYSLASDSSFTQFTPIFRQIVFILVHIECNAARTTAASRKPLIGNCRNLWPTACTRFARRDRERLEDARGASRPRLQGHVVHPSARGHGGGHPARPHPRVVAGIEMHPAGAQRDARPCGQSFAERSRDRHGAGEDGEGGLGGAPPSRGIWG